MHNHEPYTPESEFELINDGDNYAIKKYIGSQKEVSIPPMIRGRAVVAILSNAFCTEKSSFWNTEYLTTVEKVIIPETVTKLQGAFRQCKKLRCVIAHPGMEEIGDYSFFGCDNLKVLDFGMGEVPPRVVRLPRGLKKLGMYSLAKVGGECVFNEVVMSKNTRRSHLSSGDAFKPGSCAVFYYEDGIHGEAPGSYDPEASQQYTPESEFRLINQGKDYAIAKYLGSQKEVSIPPMIRDRKVVAILSGAFCTEKSSFWNTEYVTTVEEVTIPETVTKLQGAFRQCKKLRCVIAHPGMEEIGDCSFFGCDNLKVLDFGMGEVSPGVVRLPRGLKKLGMYSLAKVGGECVFNEVVMSKNTKRSHLSSADAYKPGSCAVFYYEDGVHGEALGSYDPEDSRQYTPESEFRLINQGKDYAIVKYLGSQKEVSIPPMIRDRKVVAILSGAFCTEKSSLWNTEYVTTVEKVTIPETVTKLQGTFRQCKKLRCVIAHPGIEEIGDYSFFGCDSLKVLDFGLGEVTPGVVRLPEKLKKLGMNSLAKVGGDCVFKEVVMSRKTKMKMAFNVKSCCVFYDDN